MAAFQQPWFCEHPFGVSTRFQPPSKMNTAIVRFMESCFSKLRFHKWGTVGQRPKLCVLWSGLEIGAWPVSCVRFSVAKQNKSRLETKARSHAAADSTGPPARGRGAEKEGSRSVGVSREGRNMVERVFNRMKHHRKASTRYDRLDETFLANLQLILIAIYLKNTAKNPTSANTP